MLGTVLTWALGAILAVMIMTFGIRALLQLGEKGCDIQLITFLNEFQGYGSTLEVGDVKEGVVQVPCDIDVIYFIDMDKDVSPSNFIHLPLVQDQVITKTDKRLFLKILVQFPHAYRDNVSYRVLKLTRRSCQKDILWKCPNHQTFRDPNQCGEVPHQNDLGRGIFRFSQDHRSGGRERRHT